MRRGEAWPGEARQGAAGRGRAWLGAARQGKARQGFFCGMGSFMEIPMERIPKDQWDIRVSICENPPRTDFEDGTLLLLVSCCTTFGHRYWVKIPFSEFSQNLTCVGDLERVVTEFLHNKTRNSLEKELARLFQ